MIFRRARIPDADEIYVAYFDRWYDHEDREQKKFTHTRPDMLDYYKPGLDVADLTRLTPADQEKVLDQIQVMVRTAKSDWEKYLPVTGEIDEKWIQSIDEHYTTREIAEVIKRSDPADFANELVVAVCQFGAVLGHVLLQSQPRLRWLPEWPYWESSLYDPASGNIIPPFHWAMKKFSSYGVDDGFVPKIHLCLHILDEKAVEKEA